MPRTLEPYSPKDEKCSEDDGADGPAGTGGEAGSSSSTSSGAWSRQGLRQGTVIGERKVERPDSSSMYSVNEGKISGLTTTEVHHLATREHDES